VAGTIQVQSVDRKLYEKVIECPCGLVVLISAETPNLAARSLEEGGTNVVHGDHIRAYNAALQTAEQARQLKAAEDQAREYARAGRHADARVAWARAREAKQLLRTERVRHRKLSLKQLRRGI
jgi:hypothetical protein